MLPTAAAPRSSDKQRRVGVPIEITLQGRPNTVITVGLTGLVNLNSEEVFGALMAQVQVRVLR